MMKSAIILVLLLVAAMELSAARSDLDLLQAIETIEGNEVLYKGPCCNHCGICDKRPPCIARCRCNDLVLRCHPSCRRCVRAPIHIYPPRYRCLDMSYRACHRKCTSATEAEAAAAAAAELVN